jgi:thiazole synthase ThiGH ThiG subunit
MSTFKIGVLSVSFVLGTGKFGSSQEMEEAILASGAKWLQ